MEGVVRFVSGTIAAVIFGVGIATISSKVLKWRSDSLAAAQKG